MWRSLWQRMSGPPWVARQWPHLVRKHGGASQLRDHLLTQRVIAFVGPLQYEEFTEGIARLLYLLDQDAAAEVAVWIHTPGGDVLGALSFYDAMGQASAPISTYCLGRSGGIGTLLLAAGAPGRRALDPHTLVSLDDVTARQDGRMGAELNPERDKRMMRLALDQALASKCGQAHDTIREARLRGVRFSADDAIAYGLADRVEPPRRLVVR